MPDVQSSPESPFANTLFDDPERRRTLLAIIGQAFSRPLVHRFAARPSFAQTGIARTHSINFADQAYYNAAMKVLLRERRRCAEIASAYSAKAAEEILSAPLPETWRGW